MSDVSLVIRVHIVIFGFGGQAAMSKNYSFISKKKKM